MLKLCISTNLGVPVTGDPHGVTVKLSAGHRWPPRCHGQAKCRSPVTPAMLWSGWMPVTGDPHGATVKLSAGHRWPPRRHDQVEYRSSIKPPRRDDQVECGPSVTPMAFTCSWIMGKNTTGMVQYRTTNN